jgi:hypothetical protein
VVCHEQVASLIDLRCFGCEDAKILSGNNCRPALKLTGREDEVMMQLVCDWWTTELAENRCWHVLDVLCAVQSWCISTIVLLVITMPFAFF